MTRFAPGTPQSVIKAAEQAYMNRPKIDKTAPVQPTMPKKPSPIHQRNYDRLTAMAQKRPLSQTNQRNLAFATKRLGINRDVSDTLVPSLPRISSPMATDSMPVGAADYGTSSPMPPGYNMGTLPTSTFQGGTTGGMSGGMPGATGMPNTSMLPAGAAFKRGGVVRAEKMASGGMTSKAPAASKRGDGIAQRGKTKGRMV